MRKALCVIVLLALVSPAFLGAEGGIPPSSFLEGELSLPTGSSAITLRLIEGGGGLVDLPDQGIHGYPLSALEVSEGGLRFALGLAGDQAGWLSFELRRADPVDPAHPLRLLGSFSGSGGSGEAWLEPAAALSGSGIPLAIPVKGGKLRGSLLLPPGPGPVPLVILVPGSGTTDRDGNNYAVPGRNDAYLQLALALEAEGVASFRFDKRGAGESYTLAGPEAESSFDDYIGDAEAVLSLFLGDRRFSRLSLVGHTEGGLVAASALRRLAEAGEDRAAQARGVGLAILCATGRTAVDLVEASLSEVPADKAEEARAIMASLKAGQPWPEPSAFFADFFRPSFQAYLISWFRTDLVAELKALQGPLLMVQGNRDFQVTLADFALLAAARPESPAVVLPGMNHMLKEVPGELDENWRAFSDPSFPLADGLVGLLSAWAKGQDLPAGLARFDGGRLEGGAVGEAKEVGQ